MRVNMFPFAPGYTGASFTVAPRQFVDVKRLATLDISGVTCMDFSLVIFARVIGQLEMTWMSHS